jgi:hypothetical protein
VPRQIRLFHAIVAACTAARPDAFDPRVPPGWVKRAFRGYARGTLPPRIAEWFDAELRRRNPWSALFEEARATVRRVELGPADIAALLGKGHDPIGPAALAELAAVCTIAALEHQAWLNFAQPRIAKERAERRADRLAIQRLQKRLPKYLSDAAWHDDPRQDRYRQLFAAVGDWPGFPRPNVRASFDWHERATEIADVFEAAVGPCGWHRGTPASLFMIRALRRCLQITVSPTAIEKAIPRTRQKRRREAAELAGDAERNNDKLGFLDILT